MTKKLKNTPGIGRKIIDRVNWNKREVLAIAILFTAMITLLSLGLYSQHTSKADREDVVRMRHITQMIRDKLIGAGSNVKWLDRSHCSVIPMKSFGEKVEYSCTASYRWSGLVRDQDDIDSKINLHKQVLSDIEDVIIEVIDHGGSPVYTIDSNILGRPSYDKIDHTSAYEFEINNLKRAACSVRYELVNNEARTSVYMQTDLNCFIDTKDAYFDPIERA